MQPRQIAITEFDLERLRSLIQDLKRQERGRRDLDDLQAELNRATVVTPREVPRDVITMNSTVRLVDLATAEEMQVTLVFPRDADLAAGRISVLAPIGTAILGYRLGDEIEWPVPEGVRRLRVAEILYQPEASGDYHL